MIILRMNVNRPVVVLGSDGVSILTFQTVVHL